MYVVKYDIIFWGESIVLYFVIIMSFLMNVINKIIEFSVWEIDVSNGWFSIFIIFYIFEWFVYLMGWRDMCFFMLGFNVVFI